MFKGDRSGELNGFLDAGSHIQGDLVFEDTFRVDGKLTGTVKSDGDLVVGEEGVIEAEVAVGRLFVSGTLRGKVQATRRIELASSARVEATLTSPTMVIEEGAKMDGRCITGGGTRVSADLAETPSESADTHQGSAKGSSASGKTVGKGAKQ